MLVCCQIYNTLVRSGPISKQLPGSISISLETSTLSPKVETHFWDEPTVLASCGGRYKSRSGCGVATKVKALTDFACASLSMTVLANARAFKLEVATPKLSISISYGPCLISSHTSFCFIIAMIDPTDL